MTEELAAVAFADLAGFAALTDVHGDHDAVTVAVRLAEMAGNAARPGVRVVKTIGDAVMLASSDAPDLVTTALRLVRDVHAEPRFPLVSVGVHRGPVLVHDLDLFGHTVNLAARIAGIAEPGQVLGTEVVADAIRAAGCATVRARGPVALRNISEPAQLFVLEPRGDMPGPRAVVDPVCRMRLDPSTVIASREHLDARWHFCSEVCAQRFEADPGRYVGEGGGGVETS